MSTLKERFAKFTPRLKAKYSDKDALSSDILSFIQAELLLLAEEIEMLKLAYADKTSDDFKFGMYAGYKNAELLIRSKAAEII